MKKINILGMMVALCMALFIVSCEKEDSIIVTNETEEVEVVVSEESNPLIDRVDPEDDLLYFNCLTISYPFSMIDSDGIEHLINNSEEFEALLSNSTEVEILDFVYPLTVMDESGEEITVADSEELAALYALCLPDGGWDEEVFPAYLIDEINSCFSLQFPLDLEDIDGNQITANSREEFNSLVSEMELFFVFPFTLEDESGNEVSVTGVDFLFETLLACNEVEQDSVWDWELGFEYIGCYMVNFPISIVIADGSTVEVNTHEELCDLLLSGEVSGYGYPMTLTSESGEEVIVNSDEELQIALEECFFGGGGGNPDPNVSDDLFTLLLGEATCYNIQFPLEIGLFDSNNSSVSVNSLEELFLIENPNGSVVYPVSVTFIEDGTEATVNNTEELFVLLENCL